MSIKRTKAPLSARMKAKFEAAGCTFAMERGCPGDCSLPAAPEGYYDAGPLAAAEPTGAEDVVLVVDNKPTPAYRICGEQCDGKGMPWEIGRGPDGGYIGPTKRGFGATWRWLARNGLWAPLKATPDSNCASVAKIVGGEYDGKWCGWSHRGAAVFGIGDKLFDEHWTHPDDVAAGVDPEDDFAARRHTYDTPFRLHGDVTITTDAQARQAAANCALFMS
jgi:hypothetical protein